MNDQAWLMQLELAELYQTTKQNISLHVQNILAEGELSAAACVPPLVRIFVSGPPAP